MAEYTLHCFAQSGNAYKPALALELEVSRQLQGELQINSIRGYTSKPQLSRGWGSDVLW